MRLIEEILFTAVNLERKIRSWEQSKLIEVELLELR
jgi:hypothetical protein